MKIFIVFTLAASLVSCQKTCIKGYYLSENICKLCTICDHHLLVMKPCTATNDTKCSTRSTDPPTKTVKECPISKHDVNKNGSLCCSYCDTGYGVTQQCDTSNDTRCERCKSGVNFSNVVDHLTPCQKCSKCPANSRMVYSCRIAEDVLCSCVNGFYMQSKSGTCAPCTRCPRGWGAIIACKNTSNTVCKPCPNGTFSDSVSTKSLCRTCSRCTNDQITLRSCSSTTDTTCIKRNLYNKYSEDQRHGVDLVSHNNDQLVIKSGQRSETGVDVIPIYCSLLGLVIIVLLIYVIIKHSKRIRTKRMACKYKQSQDVERPFFKDTLLAINPQEPSLNNKSLYRDIPLARRKEIARQLVKTNHHFSDWKKLARDLGYNQERISKFGAMAMNQSGPELMLDDWQKYDNSTIGRLTKALKRIKREDIIKILLTEPTQVDSSLRTVVL